MLERLLQTDTFAAASGALDGLSARHTATADNIANVNTPGYKRKLVPFEDSLARAMQNSSCQPAECRKPFTPETVRDTQTVGRADGNNVDVEQEVVTMADTTIRYDALAQYVGGFFTGLKAAITGGR